MQEYCTAVSITILIFLSAVFEQLDLSLDFLVDIMKIIETVYIKFNVLVYNGLK